LFEASNKGSIGEDFDKGCNHNTEFEDEHKTKKDSSMSLMPIKQIQNWRADVVKT